jgi:hypothetical protein
MTKEFIKHNKKETKAKEENILSLLNFFYFFFYLMLKVKA